MSNNTWGTGLSSRLITFAFHCDAPGQAGEGGGGSNEVLYSGVCVCVAHLGKRGVEESPGSCSFVLYAWKRGGSKGRDGPRGWTGKSMLLIWGSGGWKKAQVPAPSSCTHGRGGGARGGMALEGGRANQAYGTIFWAFFVFFSVSTPKSAGGSQVWAPQTPLQTKRTCPSWQAYSPRAT